MICQYYNEENKIDFLLETNFDDIGKFLNIKNISEGLMNCLFNNDIELYDDEYLDSCRKTIYYGLTHNISLEDDSACWYNNIYNFIHKIIYWINWYVYLKFEEYIVNYASDDIDINKLIEYKVLKQNNNLGIGVYIVKAYKFYETYIPNKFKITEADVEKFIYRLKNRELINYYNIIIKDDLIKIINETYIERNICYRPYTNIECGWRILEEKKEKEKAIKKKERAKRICNKKYHYVYLITDLTNNKKYIGKHSTDNLDDNYMGSGVLLKEVQDKIGIENFKKEILYIFNTEKEAYDKEREEIEKVKAYENNNYYNLI